MKFVPFTLLQRLDCVLEPTKEAVLAEKKEREKAGVNVDPSLKRETTKVMPATTLTDVRKPSASS